MSEQTWIVDPFECQHEETEVRERMLSNGSIQFRHQCLRCFKETLNNAEDGLTFLR
jgi:hypothetical protein